MKPNFALILSMDGIALLQRASQGWNLVGDAYPDKPDLAAEMAQLRAAAEALSPGTATFKVVIPNDQIRFLSVPAGSADPAARQADVNAALDGATPYALDELAVDHVVSGETLQIAAVALETIEEADEFARSFGFDPISFVAMPESRDFLGEPFFGTAHDVPDDIVVTPDEVAIRVSGHAKLPDPGDEPKAPKFSVVGDLPDESEADAAEDSDGDGSEGPVSFSSVRAREGTSKTPVGAADNAPSVASPTAVQDVSPALPPVTPPKTPVTAPKTEVTPEDLSASFKAPTAEPKAAKGPSRMAAVMATGRGLAATVRDAASRRIAAGAEARRARIDTRKAAKAQALQDAAKAALTVPTQAVGITNPQPGPPIKDVPPKPPKAKGRKKKATNATPPAAPVAEPDAIPQVVAPVSSLRAPGALSPDERRAEEERLTVFGARNADPAPDRGRAGTLVAALIIGLFLLGTAGWTMILGGAELAPIFGDSAPEEDTIAEAGSGDVEDSFVPPAPSDEPSAEPEGDRAVADPVAEPEDDAPSAPSDVASDDEVSPLIVTEAANAPDATQETDAAPDDTSDAEDEARYAASGIWQESPGDIAPAGEIAADTGADPSADPDAPPDRGPDVDLTAPLPDARPADPAPPPIYGKRYNMDDRGLVIATPDGAETPSGILAFAGEPPVVPPTRPGDPAPAAEPDAQDAPAPESDAQLIEETEAPSDATAVADLIRPRLRPFAETVADGETDTAQEDDVTLASAASLAADAVSGDDPSLALLQDRASVAAGLAAEGTEATASDETGAAAAGIEPSFLALRPIRRPANIDELAAAARVIQEPAPAIQPSGPTSVSVARQATLRRAINLREVNLIGVYGQPSDRRALVRLSNGRYRKVKVGDRIDGGRVLAIGDDSLRYQRNGRNLTLNMPSG